MKSIRQHILEKLKVSSKHNLPSIDAFIETFGKYINRTERDFNFRVLESCKNYIFGEPKTFINVLPSYEFIGNEEFLNLPGNKHFVIPKGTVYIYAIDMFKDSTQHLDDYYFTVYYLPKDGLNMSNFTRRRNFDIFKDDLVEIIGENKYLEIFNYIEHYEKN